MKKPNLLYLVGAPGTGKSTVMDEVVGQLGLEWQPDIQVWRELWVNPLYSRRDSSLVALSLGKKREGGFAGTDALSMSASPQVIKWLAQADLPPILLGEGARLGSPKFLMQADEFVHVHLVLLHADDETLDARCIGKGLSDTFRRGRKTASASCAVACHDLGLSVWTEETGRRTPAEIASSILNHWHRQ